MYLLTCPRRTGRLVLLLSLFLAGKTALCQDTIARKVIARDTTIKEPIAKEPIAKEALAKEAAAKVAGAKDPAACCCDNDTTIPCYSSDKHEKVYPKDILYDFKTKNIAFPRNARKLGRSDAVRIRVSHFNPYLYQVVIDGRDSSAHSVMDSNNLLSAFMSLTNLTTLVAGLNSTVSVGSVSKAAAAFLPTNLHVNLLQAPVQAKGQNAEPPKPTQDDKDCFKSMQTLFNGQTDRIDGLNGRISQLKEKINKSLLHWDALFAPQRHIYPDCDEFTTLAGKGNSLKQSFLTLRTSISQLYSDITKSQRDYLNGAATCATMMIKVGNDAYRVRDSLIRTYYSLAVSNLGVADSVMSYKLLLPLERAIDKMKDVTPCFTSAPIFFQGDSRIFSLAFKPIGDSSLPAYGPMVFELPWSQQRIWGVSGGFYTAYLPTEHYTGRQAIGDSLYTLVKDNTGNMEVGINALAYAAWKLSPDDPKDYNYLGVSFGAAMSINSTPKPRLLLALTYVSGHNNRLLVSLGCIAGYTDKISNAYNLIDRFSASGGYTKNVMRAGPFLSLNYSFF